MSLDWQSINNQRLATFDVLTWRTQFTRQADILRALRGQIPALTEDEIAFIEAGAEQIGVPALRAQTPVLTGELQASTRAHVYRSPDGTVEIGFEQPATNKHGVEYAPFVILGHRTRNPEITVPPNPYNRRAMQDMWEPLQALVRLSQHRLALGIVSFMREREGAAG